ncbi:unnamed protein product [Rotaria sp. Silwood2]|nr:unnamed protein product [Rotaria sp. Silwood2]
MLAILLPLILKFVIPARKQRNVTTVTLSTSMSSSPATSSPTTSSLSSMETTPSSTAASPSSIETIPSPTATSSLLMVTTPSTPAAIKTEQSGKLYINTS